MNIVMNMEITPPTHNASAFHCPLCGTYAKQTWFTPLIDEGRTYTRQYQFDLCLCDKCGDYSIWRHSTMVFPDKTTIDNPNEDLPEEIKNDYLEAASIISKSPRGAAALLRLAIQKLCHEIGCDPTQNINNNISELVGKGLHHKIQRALDIVRVTGNEAVHPGSIDLSDDEETAKKLFDLVNIIARQMISEGKKIDLMYESLPEEKRVAIEKRDKPKSS